MDQVILGKNVILSGGLGTERPNDNQIIFGGTGTGKSMSIVFPTLCHMKESSLIGTFAKRSIVSNAVGFFEKRSYKTYVWDLADPKKGEHLPDPIAYIASDDDVQEIAHQIANNNTEYQRSTKFDPYWRDTSESLLTGIIYYILMSEQQPTMKKVIDLFYKLVITENGKGITTSLDSQFDCLKKQAPDSTAVRKFMSFSQLPYATAGCVRDDLEKSIQTMFPQSIQAAMSRDAYIDFRKLATNRTAVFIITSPVRPAQYAFANLLFGIAIRRLMEFAEHQPSGKLPRDVKLIFDDFSCGFPVLNFEKSISTFRAAGISSLMLCQSLSQLDATYGQDNSTVILDNCSSLVYMPGGMNKKTCSYISEILDRPLNEIMFMGMGNVICFQTGKQPIITQRYDTLSDPLYQELICSSKEDIPLSYKSA